MKRIKLALAFHNHQPVGNFPWVIGQAYREAYEPLVAALERHAHVRVALHYTGPLLDWLREEQPAFLPRIRALVERGQVEIMGGAYYEPILASIPDLDKLGQLDKMSQVLEDELGTRPSGAWMAERVWEPHLPRFLAEGGIAWTILDDMHFKMAGLDDTDLDGYYLTEEMGRAVKVYATSQRLRYLIPWATVPQVIQYLRDAATDDGQRLLVMGDDGEKFGAWPTTYKHCWQDGWMDAFFRALADERDWLELVLLGEHALSAPPRGRIYLPTASYAEMMEWSLPPDRARELSTLREAFAQEGREDVVRYLRAGFWRNFLAKYPEVNAMHKKMLRVHGKVWQAMRRAPEDDCGLDELWQGQCNCPYWHGVFGGIYMTAIRAEMYRRLIRAEAKAERVLHGTAPWLAIEVVDYDADGWPEVLVEGAAAKLVVAPHHGGALIEWDLVRPAWNLLATMARRPEAYHAALQSTAHQATATPGVRLKDADVASALGYDRYGRYGALEHFLGAEALFEDFRIGRYDDAGDVAGAAWQVEHALDEHGAHVRLARSGTVCKPEQQVGMPAWPVRIEKTLTLSAAQDELSVRYRVRNEGDAPLATCFVSEWNANLVGGGGNPAAYVHVPGHIDRAAFDSSAEHDGVQRFQIGNDHLGVHLRFEASTQARLWRFSVDSVSSSEGGLERVHQGTCFALVWALALAPGEEWTQTLRWTWE
jgi:alpha-amylase